MHFTEFSDSHEGHLCNKEKITQALFIESKS